MVGFFFVVVVFVFPLSECGISRRERKPAFCVGGKSSKSSNLARCIYFLLLNKKVCLWGFNLLSGFVTLKNACVKNATGHRSYLAE
jgi:hypothetical protein